ncbi:flagellar hook-basal body complex protein FliE [Sporolactobacillus sp. KGMB 08714]|uniref:flagellar hook-basal body complex protein FliE n=1 Tax=Sporolactobacillus sp. KGMB 08714 TaxID=3064704 RepID=UPI002FBD9DE8
MSINPVGFAPSTTAVSQTSPSVSSAQQSFTSMLENAIGTVNDSQQTANQMVTDLANGTSNVDLHNVMIAMQKADVMLKTAVQVRDRVVSAYQDVMGMQI